MYNVRNFFSSHQSIIIEKPKKKRRNIIVKAIGTAVFGAATLIGVDMLFPRTDTTNFTTLPVGNSELRFFREASMEERKRQGLFFITQQINKVYYDAGGEVSGRNDEITILRMLRIQNYFRDNPDAADQLFNQVALVLPFMNFNYANIAEPSNHYQSGGFEVDFDSGSKGIDCAIPFQRISIFFTSGINDHDREHYPEQLESGELDVLAIGIADESQIITFYRNGRSEISKINTLMNPEYDTWGNLLPECEGQYR